MCEPFPGKPQGSAGRRGSLGSCRRAPGPAQGFYFKDGLFFPGEGKPDQALALTNTKRTMGLEKPGSSQEHPGVAWSTAKASATRL